MVQVLGQFSDRDPPARSGSPGRYRGRRSSAACSRSRFSSASCAGEPRPPLASAN